MNGNAGKGRPKGSKNKHSFNAEELAQKFDKDPLEILLLFAHGKWKELGYDNECYFAEKADGAVKMGYTITPEMRIQAAKDACKYLHSAKQAVALSGAEGIKIIVEDYTKKDLDG